MNSQKALASVLLYIPRDHIAFLRFLLEGYEGLASLSTEDRWSGLVRLAFPRSRTREFWGFMSDFAAARGNEPSLCIKPPCQSD